MVNQTTPQNVNAVRFGSAKMEIGATLAALQDMGALRNVKFIENFAPFTVKSDNAGEVMAGVADQSMLITADWLEPDLAKLNTLRGGIDTYSTTAGSSTPVTDEAVILSGYIFSRVANRDAAGAMPTGIVVSSAISGGGTNYVLGTDYYVALDPSGYLAIARKNGGSITDGQTVYVDYTYTAAASKTLKSGGKRKMNYIAAKLTNTNEAGKKLYLYLYRCQVTTGMQFTYVKDDGTEVAAMPISIKATLDVTRTAGDQLYNLTDEQGV